MDDEITNLKATGPDPAVMQRVMSADVPPSVDPAAVEAPVLTLEVLQAGILDVSDRLVVAERQVALLRRALKDYYDIDGKGFVG